MCSFSAISSLLILCTRHLSTDNSLGVMWNRHLHLIYLFTSELYSHVSPELFSIKLCNLFSVDVLIINNPHSMVPFGCTKIGVNF